MARHIQDKTTGKMAGSIGDGRDTVPSAAAAYAGEVTPAVAEALNLAAAKRALAHAPEPYTPRIGNRCVADGCSVRPRKRYGICAEHYDLLVSEFYADLLIDPERMDTLIAASVQEPFDPDAEDILRRTIRVVGQPMTRDQLHWLATHTDSYGMPWVAYVDMHRRPDEVTQWAADAITADLVNRELDEADRTGFTWAGMNTAAQVIADTDTIDRLIEHPWQRGRLAYNLAANPHLTEAQVMRLAWLDPDVWDRLAINPACGPTSMHKLLDMTASGSRVFTVTHRMAANPRATEAVLRRIFTMHQGAAVLIALAENPNTPGPVVDQLLDHVSPATAINYRRQLANAVLAHPHTGTAAATKARRWAGTADARVTTGQLNDMRLVYALETPALRETARRLIVDGWHGTMDELITTARLLNA